MRCRFWRLSWLFILGLLLTQGTQAKSDSTKWRPTLRGLHVVTISKFSSSSDFREFATRQKGSAGIERSSFQALSLPFGRSLIHSDHFTTDFGVGPTMFWMSGITRFGGNLSLRETIKLRKNGKTNFQIGVDYFKPLITTKTEPNDPFLVNPKNAFTFNIGWNIFFFKNKIPDVFSKLKHLPIPAMFGIYYSRGLVDQDVFQGLNFGIGFALPRHKGSDI